MGIYFGPPLESKSAWSTLNYTGIILPKQHPK